MKKNFLYDFIDNFSRYYSTTSRMNIYSIIFFRAYDGNSFGNPYMIIKAHANI